MNNENNKTDEDLSLTKLRVSKITSNHADSQSKLRDILMKKKQQDKNAANDSEGFDI